MRNILFFVSNARQQVFEVEKEIIYDNIIQSGQLNKSAFYLMLLIVLFSIIFMIISSVILVRGKNKSMLTAVPFIALSCIFAFNQFFIVLGLVIVFNYPSSLALLAFFTFIFAYGVLINSTTIKKKGNIFYLATYYILMTINIIVLLSQI
ncbi:hypothetical protein JXE04_01660 [Patescibacteria group bacterium]|nr:hypothetical protein [Patescibacteria group bacterium]